MIEHPFMLGDRVYVADVEHKLPVTFVTEDTVTVRLDDGTDYVATPGKFSYSPWPKPDHKRPLDDGEYLFVHNGSPSIFYGVAQRGLLVRQKYLAGTVTESAVVEGPYTIIKKI